MMLCGMCAYSMDAIDANTEHMGTGESLFSSCWEFTCYLCASSTPRAQGRSSHHPPCPVTVLSTEIAGTSVMNSNLSMLAYRDAAGLVIPPAAVPPTRPLSTSPPPCPTRPPSTTPPLISSRWATSWPRTQGRAPLRCQTSLQRRPRVSAPSAPPRHPTPFLH